MALGFALRVDDPSNFCLSLVFGHVLLLLEPCSANQSNKST